MSEEKLNVNLQCNVCYTSDFKLREGFYYCNECGTKQEDIRDFEVENEDDYKEQRFLKKQKIVTTKAEKPELTSWECYNYILRGMVEKLLSLGAKTELILMALQLWAARVLKKRKGTGGSTGSRSMPLCDFLVGS